MAPTPATPESTGPPGAPGAVAPASGPVGLDPIEAEIARLTNELRTNPNGPRRRQGPVIDCGGRLLLDEAGTGYLPVPALVVHGDASLGVSRPWAAQLTSDLRHRPRAGLAVLGAIGIEVWAAGENIGYNTYSDPAEWHVAGWRESDGHFCNLMDPRYSHLAVGESTSADGVSYAVQNFFTPAG